MSKILITGAIGFIGFHLSEKLLEDKTNVILGIDNIDEYYDVSIKYTRLNILKEHSNFIFDKINICDKIELEKAFKAFKPDYVVNLAAQAGVRYSMVNPDAYIETNIKGFVNVLELCKTFDVKHLVFASSASVYGSNQKIPFSVNDTTDHPISIYGATKKANEALAHAYSAMYNLNCSGVRFFSVYGIYGRPDLALFKFTKNIIEGIPIDVYGDGNSTRSYTYVSDVIDCVVKIINILPDRDKYWKPDTSTSIYPYKIYNVGSNCPIRLNTFIKLIEDNLNIKAIKNYLPMQLGDIQEASSDIDNVLFEGKMPVNIGVKIFVDWFKNHYYKKRFI